MDALLDIAQGPPSIYSRGAPRIAYIKFASPFDMAIMLGSGVATAGGVIALTKLVANTLVELTDQVFRLKRDKQIYDTQRAAAMVLENYLVNAARHQQLNETSKKRKPAGRGREPQSSKKASQKAALALAVIQTVHVEE